MKYFITIFCCIAICTIELRSQNSIDVDSVKYYLMPWNERYCKPYRTIKNIRNTFLFSFYVDGDGLEINKMFLDYNDGLEKLANQKTLSTPDTIKKVGTTGLVDIYFTDKKMLSLYFDNEGNYFFQNKWHEINYGLYYLLFKYFSNEIIPKTILEESKKKCKDEFWHHNNK